MSFFEIVFWIIGILFISLIFSLNDCDKIYDKKIPFIIRPFLMVFYAAKSLAIITFVPAIFFIPVYILMFIFPNHETLLLVASIICGLIFYIVMYKINNGKTRSSASYNNEDMS